MARRSSTSSPISLRSTASRTPAGPKLKSFRSANGRNLPARSFHCHRVCLLSRAAQPQVSAMAFFKRAPYDSPTAGKDGQVTTVAALPQALETSELRRVVNPVSLGFKTTDELDPVSGLIGQERALRAIQFGTNIKSYDFNIFVLGPAASGKTTAVKAHLGPKAAQMPTPVDWVYVYNFENPNRPKALQLPHGRGKALARGMVAT